MFGLEWSEIAIMACVAGLFLVVLRILLAGRRANRDPE
jgi:hypothetical protein